jgi:hypothetical protein
LHIPGIFYENGQKRKITELSQYSFYLTNIIEVYLPSTIDTIRLGSFEQMNSLKFIDLSKTKIISLEAYMFSRSINLETVLLPPNIELIRNNTFQSCKNIKELVLPPTVKTIDQFAFKLASVEKLIFCGTSVITGELLESTVKSLILPINYIGDSFCGLENITKQTFFCDFLTLECKTLRIKHITISKSIFFIALIS